MRIQSPVLFPLREIALDPPEPSFGRQGNCLLGRRDGTLRISQRGLDLASLGAGSRRACLAGLERAVVCLGENASAVEHAVQTHAPKIKVDYVYSPPSLWRNLANSILMCKAAFKTDEPLLIVRADQLYDWRLLRKIVCAPFVPGIDAFALVDLSLIHI